MENKEKIILLELRKILITEIDNGLVDMSDETQETKSEAKEIIEAVKCESIKKLKELGIDYNKLNCEHSKWIDNLCKTNPKYNDGDFGILAAYDDYPIDVWYKKERVK